MASPNAAGNQLNDEFDTWCGVFGKASEQDPSIRANRDAEAVGWRRGEPLPQSSVDLVMGSPPFASGVPYPSGYNDDKSKNELAAELARHFAEIARVLRPGRFVFVHLPMATYVRGKVVFWPERATRLMKAAGLRVGVPPLILSGRRLVLPDVSSSTRRVVQFGADADVLLWGSRGEPDEALRVIPDLRVEDRQAWYRNTWSIEPECDLAVYRANPVPWSREVPYRIALLASLPGELIVDPWCGSGRTGAALMGGPKHVDHPMRPRRFLGQDLAPQTERTRRLLRRDWRMRHRSWRMPEADRHLFEVLITDVGRRYAAAPR